VRLLQRQQAQGEWWAVFISNTARKVRATLGPRRQPSEPRSHAPPPAQVPVFRQRAGSGSEGAVLWDYHVVALQRGAGGPRVWDLDSTLPFGTPLEQYVREALQSVGLDTALQRRYRVVHAPRRMHDSLPSAQLRP